MSLLMALTDYYKLVYKAARDPTLVESIELGFVPEPGDDIEAMFRVLSIR